MKHLIMWIVAAVFLSATACSERGDVSPSRKTVLQVDHLALTLQDFNHFFEPVKMSYGKDNGVTIRDARRRYLLQLVEEMLIVRRAEELGITIAPENLETAISEIKKDYTEDGFNDMLMKQAISFDTWRDRLHRQLLVEEVIHQDLEKEVVVTPEDLHVYFDEHKETWHHREKVHVLQILVHEKEKATSILNDIKNGEDFSDMAKEHSAAPEAQQGGDLGFVHKGDLPEELERPIFKLGQNDVSAVVKTSFGFHIFKVLEKKPAGEPTLNDLIEEIKIRVKQEKVKEAYGPWLAKLRSQYDVTLNEDLL